MKLARPMALVVALFDYATHGTSLGPRNLQISGDVLGSPRSGSRKSSGRM